MRLLAFIALPVLSSRPVWAVQYSILDTYQGPDFFSMFQFFTAADPTHGRVNYVSQDIALGTGLTTVDGDNVRISTDNTTYLTANGPGRNSVRITSNSQYTTHVSIFNIFHMPQGCGTWPAIWEDGSNWPAGGEIDILEGVNNQIQNLVTLHTAPGCSMPPSRVMTGSQTGLNCSAAVSYNAGCGATLVDGTTYGVAFNDNGGGWFDAFLTPLVIQKCNQATCRYAMERTSSFVKVWFWGRDSVSIPNEVINGANLINTDGWGMPAAYFPSTNCNISSYFGPANIIINIGLCGDWAGDSTVYAASGCPSTCIDFVNNNPSAFSDAFFEFSWIKVYQ
ncbi:endo-beta-glucanase [Russula dissimulans]|nr:endo-beta-glucanase [Russula dissimulans]